MKEIVQKIVFFFDELCFRVKAFLAKDNWFIFEGILKIKVNKCTNLYLR